MTKLTENQINHRISLLNEALEIVKRKTKTAIRSGLKEMAAKPGVPGDLKKLLNKASYHAGIGKMRSFIIRPLQHKLDELENDLTKDQVEE